MNRENEINVESDERWQDIADAMAAGDQVTEADRAFAREFAADDAAVRAEENLLAELESLGSMVPEASDRDEAILAGVLEATEPRSRRGLWALGTVAAAAAAVAMLWGPSPDEAPVGEVVAAAPAVAAPQVSNGQFTLEGDRVAAGDAVPTDRWMEAGSHSCLELGHGQEACGESGTRIKWNGGEGVDVALDRGSLHASSATGPLHVALPEGEIRGEAADVKVDVAPDAVTVVVLVGPIMVEVAGDRRTLESGSNVTIKRSNTIAIAVPPELEPEAEPEAEEDIVEETTADTAAPASRLSAAELLGRAQEHRGAGDLKAAAASYRRLLRDHPRSPEAHAVLPSLGKIELTLGQPRAALRHFDRYLETGGPTAEEARRGRIDALGKLGKTAAQRKAMEEFLRKHPGSLHADGVRAKLHEDAP